MNPPRRLFRSRRAGLTLIEVLLAIALLGISIPILLVAVQRGLGVARRAVQLETARRLVGALEVEHAIDWDGIPEFEAGSFESPFSTYRWERAIQPAAESDLPLFEVTTRILWSDRGRDTGETWVTLRYVPDESGGVFERADPARGGVEPGPGRVPSPAPRSNPNVPRRPGTPR